LFVKQSFLMDYDRLREQTMDRSRAQRNLNSADFVFSLRPLSSRLGSGNFTSKVPIDHPKPWDIPTVSPLSIVLRLDAEPSAVQVFVV
jgi:hypothetical protein